MKKKIKIALVSIFLALLIAPNLIMVLGLESNLQNNENRVHTSFPELNFKNPLALIGTLKNYYLENFGSKTFLVNNYIDFKRNILDENPIPHRIVEGKNNSFFLGNEFNNVLDNSFGNDPVTKKELDKIVENITNISTYLNSKGIDFYVVIPPDKHNIYKEDLPFKLQQKVNKLQTIKSHLKKELDFNIIDLTNVLLANKSKQELYIKSDSHWNDFGGYIGYIEMMKHINRKNDYKISDSSQYHIIDTITTYGGNTKTINYFPTEKNIIFRKKTPFKSTLIYKKKNNYKFENPEETSTLAFYGDSFSNNFIQLLRDNFKTTYFLRGHTISKSFIEKEKPKLVIFQIIERNINTILAKEKPLTN